MRRSGTSSFWNPATPPPAVSRPLRGSSTTWGASSRRCSRPLPGRTGSGQVKGLIDARDGTLAGLQEDLGNLAQVAARAYNTQSNANVAFPPPTSLIGRNTGLLGGDALNFTGKTMIGVTDANGALVSRLDVDFDAGTISVDGGPPAAFAGTIDDFTTTLNGALGVNGTASFANGVLTVSANSPNGIVAQDDAATPANRGGAGFSQFFGLNDLFRSGVPQTKATGLSGGDAGGFTAGGTIGLSLSGPNGEIAKTATVSVASGDTDLASVRMVLTATGTMSEVQVTADLLTGLITDVHVVACSGIGAVSAISPTGFHATWFGDVTASQPLTITVSGQVVATGTFTTTANAYWGLGFQTRRDLAVLVSVNDKYVYLPAVMR